MINLVDFETVKTKFDAQTRNDITSILNDMASEGLSLEGWKLVEIPAESTYCFYNPEMKAAFDFELDAKGVLRPHYYCVKEETKVTKFPTKAIKSAIALYQL